MKQFFSISRPPALPRLMALPAFLTLLLALSAAPSLAQTPPCNITVVNIWSDDPDKTFTNNTLSVEEGAAWDFDLQYSCGTLRPGESPQVSIVRPSRNRFDTVDFRGGISEVDGVADGDRLTGACLTEAGCRIEIFGTTKDNNCRNVGATVQEMRVETRVTNAESGGRGLNLSDKLTVTIEARDDDTLSQKYLDMGYTQWKPTC